MDAQHSVPEWEQLAGEVARELAAWRAAHPRATLAEIEQAVEEALSRLRARYLSDLTHASAAADLARVPPAERPPCPACGGALQPRGRTERQVLTPRQAAPLRVRRSYSECSACGAGFFPPG